VTDRVLRAADRYPREAAFYRSLSMRARVAFEVSADGRFAGPWVRIYDLGA
jgi:hypothetical protein